MYFVGFMVNKDKELLLRRKAPPKKPFPFTTIISIIVSVAFLVFFYLMLVFLGHGAVETLYHAN